MPDFNSHSVQCQSVTTVTRIATKSNNSWKPNWLPISQEKVSKGQLWEVTWGLLKTLSASLRVHLGSRFGSPLEIILGSFDGSLVWHILEPNASKGPCFTLPPHPWIWIWCFRLKSLQTSHLRERKGKLEWSAGRWRQWAVGWLGSSSALGQSQKSVASCTCTGQEHQKLQVHWSQRNWVAFTRDQDQEPALRN